MSTVDVVLVAVRLAIGVWLLWSLPRLPRPARPAHRSGVSVVVPARDEAEQLPHLLRSLPSDVEVVVVDDDSSDATAAVASDLGATVRSSAPLPPGWAGKPWACAVGTAATTGDRLVFVDADVRFAPGGFDAVLACLDRTDGLVSVQPFHEPGAPVEHLAALCNVVALAATDTASPLGRRAGSRGAFGPVLACRRTHHEQVGGHEVVRDRVDDDVGLAEAYRRAGLDVRVLAGGDDVSFRMYPRGLGQLVEGFGKNLAAGAASVRPVTVALVVAWVTLLVQAAVAPLRAAASGDGLAWALALYGVVALQVWWMSRRVGRFGPLIALAFPAPLVVFLGTFAWSTWGLARGSVSWRGRRVAPRR